MTVSFIGGGNRNIRKKKPTDLSQVTDKPYKIQICLLHTLNYTPKLTMRDKRDDFNLLIVNFSFICSNIPAAPVYGVYMYISQLIRYSKAYGFYQDFLNRGLLLTRNQGFLLVKLKLSIRTFYGRHRDLVDRFGISVSQMTIDMIHLS